MADESSNETSVSAEQARERIAKSEARVLDLRSDEEWSTVGNIPNSVRAEDGNAAEAAKQIDDDTQMIVVCADGSDSAEVAEKLRDDGRDAISIEGGMGSWEDEGYVLQPSADPDPPGEGEPLDEDEGEDGDGDQDGDEGQTPEADAGDSGQGDEPPEEQTAP